MCVYACTYLYVCLYEYTVMYVWLKIFGIFLPPTSPSVYCFSFSSFHHCSLRRIIIGTYSIVVLDAGSYSKPIVSKRNALIAVVVLSKLLLVRTQEIQCYVCMPVCVLFIYAP
jgi:hypothetical protein